MAPLRRLIACVRSWWQPADAAPQEPPVPGRPGGKVGNTKREESGAALTTHPNEGIGHW